MSSKIKGFVDMVDCMPTKELRTSIRVHANASPTADVPAILVITEEEVFTKSEVQELVKDAKGAIEYLVAQLEGHVYWKEIHNGKPNKVAHDLAAAAVDDAKYTLKNLTL